ncbi:MAG: YwiC-like family protein [Micrococcaceae bacterium]|nr:YwiC-like family protein [Micrococcaceae bacterium]
MTNPFHEPAESGDSDDAVWEDLVRRLESGPPTAQGPTETHAGETPRGVDPRIFRMHPALTGPRDYEVSEDEDEGGFTPEDPPALGSGNPLTTLAWVCAAGAPIALALLAIFWRRAPAPLWIGLVVLAVAATVFLFAKLPRHRHDGDDGARV